MQVELVAEDLLVRPMIGPGGLTRKQAHAEIQGLLDRAPALAETAAIWQAGAKDDTVYLGPFTWTIYEYDGDDPRRGAIVWLDDYAEIVRGAGVDVQVAQLPD